MGFADDHSLWKNGIVPFVIFSGFTENRKRIIRSAIRQFNAQIYSVEFRPRLGTDKDFVFFTSGAGCSSVVGKHGGQQNITCTPNPRGRAAIANSVGRLLHEMGHAIGLYHEHQRRDQNKNVTIQTNNIKPEFLKWYNAINIRESYGNYDHSSIMHYGRSSADFSIDPGNDVITPPAGVTIGQRNGLSAGDIRTIELLYGRKAGNLLWYNHEADAAGFDFDYGKPVGTGWGRFRHVFSGQIASGSMYGIESNGDLKWYRHMGAATGERRWRRNTGVLVGKGWDRFSHVFSSRSGVIYAIEKNGDLRWYRHTGFTSGVNRWHDRSNTKIGSGWDRFSQVFATTGGRIYAIEKNGDLKWYHHTAWNTGTKSWAGNTGRKVGSGWQSRKKVFASGANIYGVDNDGDLNWYFHQGILNGTSNWRFSTGRKIGTGWDMYKTLLTTGNGRIYGLVGD